MVNQLEIDEHALKTDTIALLLQTLFYGAYIIIVGFTSFIMYQKGLAERARRTLFILMLFMFSLATMYWIASMVHLAIGIQTSYFGVDPSSLPSKHRQYFPMIHSVVLINYVITDGVVVWRCYTLCRDDFKKALFIPITLLGFTSLGVLTIIFMRAAITYRVDHGHPESSPLSQPINYTQIITLLFTLLCNLSATGIVAIKAWKERKIIQEYVHKDTSGNSTTKAQKILGLLIESGLLYCASNIMLLVSALVRLPHGTLGDIYQPINVQIAGLYPALIFIIVTRQQDPNMSVFSSFSSVGGTHNHRQPHQVQSALRFKTHTGASELASSDGRTASTETYRLESKAPSQIGGSGTERNQTIAQSRLEPLRYRGDVVLD